MSELWQSITSETVLTKLLSDSELESGVYSLILKHSHRCGISAMAKSRLERKIDSRIAYFIIDVIKHRDVSNALATATGIEHESPQAFLFNGSVMIDVRSHMGISASELSKRIDSLKQIQT